MTMDNEHKIWLGLLGIGLLTAGFLAGFWAGYGAPTATHDDHAHADEELHGHDEHADEEHAHSHDETAAAQTRMNVSLHAHKDSKSGYNIRIETTNFSFAPHNAGKNHSAGEGHAHLYANGEKIARVYGEWHKIGEYPHGTQLTAALYTNDHHLYAYQGEPVEDTITLTDH